jgi:hypothetical protein
MLYLTNADTNDNIEVLNVSDSYKLYLILDEKRVIVEFTGMWQPVGKRGGKWRRMTGKMVRSSSFVRISDDWRKVRLEKNELFYDALMVSIIQMLIN